MFFMYTSLREKQVDISQTQVISHFDLNSTSWYQEVWFSDDSLCCYERIRRQQLNWLCCNESFLRWKGYLILRAAGWPGSARSPDGFLPLLWIRGHVRLHLFGRPLYLHLNNLWRTEMETLSLLSRWVSGRRSHAKCCNIMSTPAAALWVRITVLAYMACKTPIKMGDTSTVPNGLNVVVFSSALSHSLFKILAADMELM